MYEDGSPTYMLPIAVTVFTMIWIVALIFIGQV